MGLVVIVGDRIVLDLELVGLFPVSYPLLSSLERSREQYIRVVGKLPHYVRVSPGVYRKLRLEVSCLLRDQGGERFNFATDHVTNLSGVDVVVGGPPDPPFEHYSVERLDE